MAAYIFLERNGMELIDPEGEATAVINAQVNIEETDDSGGDGSSKNAEFDRIRLGDERAADSRSRR